MGGYHMMKPIKTPLVKFWFMHSYVRLMKYKICQIQVLDHEMTVSLKHQTMQDTFKIITSSRYQIFLSYFSHTLTSSLHKFLSLTFSHILYLTPIYFQPLSYFFHLPLEKLLFFFQRCRENMTRIRELEARPRGLRPEDIVVVFSRHLWWTRRETRR